MTSNHETEGKRNMNEYLAIGESMVVDDSALRSESAVKAASCSLISLTL